MRFHGRRRTAVECVRHARLLAGATCLALAAGAALPGCGRSVPELVPVRGTLLLDGEPLGGKSIQFSPAVGTKGLGAGATSGPDGSFALLATLPGAVRDYPGVMPGTYRVVVSEPLIPIDAGQPERSEGSSDPAPAIGPPVSRPTRTDIPAKYRGPDTTPLTIKIQPGQAEITLELRSKP